MLLLRKFHLYLGTLFAPAIIFFALSGMLQVIGLHEAEDAEAAQPPQWIVTLASIHKDQRLSRPKAQKMPGAIEQMRADHAQEPAPDHADGHDHDHGEKGAPEAVDWSQKLLKAFALLMALGLIVSAVMGIVIALNNPRTRRTAIVMLLAGILLPLGVLAI